MDNGAVASAKGFGLEHALKAWGTYMISLLNDGSLFYSVSPCLDLRLIVQKCVDCGGDINE